MNPFKFSELTPYIYSDIIKYLSLKNQIDYQVLDKNWRDATKQAFRQYKTLVVYNDDHHDDYPYDQFYNGREKCHLHDHHFRGPTINITEKNYKVFCEERVMVNFSGLISIYFGRCSFDDLNDFGRLPPLLEHIHIANCNNLFKNNVER